MRTTRRIRTTAAARSRGQVRRIDRSRVAASSAPTRACRRAEDIATDALLTLQRSAGNTATARFLALQRQAGGAPPTGDGAEGAGGKDAADSAGGGGASCAQNSNCPEDFCVPMDPITAQVSRLNSFHAILAAIGGAVSTRVVGMWWDYIWGGSPLQDRTSDFGADFTAHADTKRVTEFLVKALEAKLAASPPVFPPGTNEVTVKLEDHIKAELDEVGDATSSNRLRFSGGTTIPGNIAGGIDVLQASCAVGATPSTMPDARTAGGTALVTRLPDGSLTVTPSIQYAVRDTVDFCPGNCGSDFLTQRFTLLMSRWEAAGISGDVPFVVEFPAPALGPPVPIPPPSPPPPPPTPPPPPVVLPTKVLFDYDSSEVKNEGKETLSKLLPQLRESPSTDIVGHTDARGSEAYNQGLSERRAQAVVDELIRQDPALAGRLHPSGQGETAPVESNDTDEGRARNRRVEVIFGP